ncbi:MAG: hypothetical protein JNK90_16530 [Planctomycetaceae bacterium]|nr:hypothetical protein [Planctomycetaceae bacterium]
MNSNETTLPFFLRSHRIEVEKHLGAPKSGRSEFGEDIQHYTQHGLTIKYKDELVIEIQSNGSDFQGKMCDISIGDPIEMHWKRLGEPMSRKDLASSTKLTWAVQDFFLVAEIWNETGNEEGIGAFVKDHVREVELKSRLLTPKEERARCAEIFSPMFPGMSLEQVEAILLAMESKSIDDATA